MSYQPVIVIGAPRSGTNMLRDLLAALPNVATWPCDELNYLWRHGNARYPTDELRPEHATQRVKQVLQAEFARLARKTGANWLVEKTCANSLRVDFVHSIFPNAKYIFLVRNGLDVVASSKLRWTAPLDLKYLLKKARYVPWEDVPNYAIPFVFHRIKRLFHPEGQLPTWGPRFASMREAITNQSLEHLCLSQWQKCVLSASSSLQKLPQSQVCFVSYESFVESPGDELSRLCGFLNVSFQEGSLNSIVAHVSKKSVGNGRAKLSADKIKQLTPRVEETLAAIAKVWLSIPIAKKNALVA